MASKWQEEDGQQPSIVAAVEGKEEEKEAATATVAAAPKTAAATAEGDVLGIEKLRLGDREGKEDDEEQLSDSSSISAEEALEAAVGPPSSGAFQGASMEDDGVGQEGEGPDLVRKVERFFFENEAFADFFEAWVMDHAGAIDLATAECKFEYTRLYEEFKQLFEDKITAFIEAEGGSVEAFFEQIQRQSAADPWSSESVFGQILVATTDFDVFMLMMREAAAERQRQQEQEQEQEQEQQEAKEGKEGKEEEEDKQGK